MTQSSASTLVRQADLFGALLMSDVCERFPRLKFVAVESGFGHLPFTLRHSIGIRKCTDTMHVHYCPANISVVSVTERFGSSNRRCRF
jgi:hypothetical protein